MGVWVCKDLAPRQRFQWKLDQCWSPSPKSPACTWAPALTMGGGGREESGLHPWERCFPVECVGWERLWAVGPSKCISSAVEGNSLGPQLTLPGPSPADLQINSYHQLGCWVSGVPVAAWAALIYHPGPKQIKSPRVIWILPGLVTEVLENAVWQETSSVLFGGSLRALEIEVNRKKEVVPGGFCISRSDLDWGVEEGVWAVCMCKKVRMRARARENFL